VLGFTPTLGQSGVATLPNTINLKKLKISSSFIHKKKHKGIKKVKEMGSKNQILIIQFSPMCSIF
jgi:hypothetical protein